MTFFAYISSPIGDILIVSDGAKLTRVCMEKQKHGAVVDPAWTENHRLESIAGAAAQLSEYFAGDRREFRLPLAMQGTVFQKKVWHELTKVPFGTTTSYGELARKVGSPNGARAVGLANGKNPFAIIVPCHRVIGSDGDLTGYGGGLPKKRRLLDMERRADVV